MGSNEETILRIEEITVFFEEQLSSIEVSERTRFFDFLAPIFLLNESPNVFRKGLARRWGQEDKQCRAEGGSITERSSKDAEEM